MSKESWRKVEERESHFLEFSNTQKWGEICLMAKGAKMYSGTEMAEAEVLKLYCMVSFYSILFLIYTHLWIIASHGDDG
jgi:hypothetical protein